MSEQERQVVADVIDAVRDALGRHGVLATSIVVLAETIEPDADIAMWTAVDAGTKPWQALGILHFAVQREQANLITDDE